ncbi:protein FAM174C [Pungitius pungitius]|uniref:protein FAM174C n=1 Tax=Pungitius pungitius TaxID=134920 RepID=UPI0018875216|nr:protein FAM174C [Pungitius pungitius]
MTPVAFMWAVLVPLGWMFASAAEEAASAGGGGGDPPPGVTRPAGTNSSGGNATHGGGKSPRGMLDGLGADSSMIQRALYVLIGITVIGVLYFLIRAVRLKRPAHKKKYGLLSNYDDSVEMEAVESEEDDTLYEARSLRR